MALGGLSLKHPRFGATTSLVLTTSQCISYATRGIYMATQAAPITLPPEYTCLYSDWDSSDPDSTVFTSFHHYAHQIVSIADNKDPTIHTTPPNNSTPPAASSQTSTPRNSSPPTAQPSLTPS